MNIKFGINFIGTLFVLFIISKADLENNFIRLDVAIQFQNKINVFVDELLSTNLNLCYVIHFRNYETSVDSGQLTSIGTLPIIEISSGEMMPPSSFFDTFDKIHIPRHGRQCKIYFIHLYEAKISDIFDNSALQIQAHQSYIILMGQQTQNMVEQILFSPKLDNYKHRIWLQIPDINSNPILEFHMKHHYYCYTCSKNSKPGLILTTTNSFQNSLIDLFPDVTKNLNGYTLICTAPQAPPLVAIVNSKHNSNEKIIVGMQEIILKEMAKKMNFTFILKQAHGGATGIPLPNGTWTGIMGEILSKEADIGLSVATSYERNKILEFTVPVFHAFLVLVSVKPSPYFDWEAIFYPFNKTAWIAIMISTFLTVICFHFLLNNQFKKKTRGISLFKSAYLTVGALLEQGVPMNLSTGPSRLFAGFWFMFAIVVTCAYRSKLFLFLTFPTIEKPPSTLKELSVSDYTWGMKSLGGVGILLITKSPLAYSRYIGEHLEVSFDKYSCLDKTFTNRFVCIIYKAYIDYMAVVRYWKINHKFYVSDYVTTSVGSSWVLRKYSPLLPALDKYHISQFEMGLAKNYVEQYQQDVAIIARAHAQVSNSSEDTFGINTDYVREENGPKSLQLGNVGGAFFILFCGFVNGGCLFLVEFARKYYKKELTECKCKLQGRTKNCILQIVARYIYLKMYRNCRKTLRNNT